jgi:hypothetical protein
MAKSTDVDVVNGPVAIGMDDAGFEWETVHVEAARIIGFDLPGDTYIGVLRELEWIVPDKDKPAETFLQAKFEDQEGITAINCGAELEAYFTDAELGYAYRIQMVKFVDTGKKDPMKSFRIDRASVPVDASTAE